ncbi:hypothetical protein [Bacteriovorax sp. Seq25_V]|uniref:hypothetical protein n=1 Tax=Bacteriovorax sp. Seq25_V TaxID=1201288 RepID=UPI000389FE10|nr:hypothetical protein [Bacteriovorax sp. Seq25_V]EQC45710.1 hypothetical protein M900_1857 [Bacteriovorax sp. Seq25_V]
MSNSNEEMSKKNQVIFVINLMIIFSILGYFKYQYFYIVVLLLFLSLFFDLPRQSVVKVFIKISSGINYIISPLLFFLFFFFVLTPFSMLRRVVSNDLKKFKKLETGNTSNFSVIALNNEEKEYQEYW